MNKLFFGDNLVILREHIADESVDLIYLDPPFNSKRDYNLLFKTPKGHSADAQITAFEDSWHWGEQAEREYNELLRQSNTDVAEMIRALRSFLGENDMMAYLTMMANRLIELHKVLKPTGSLYLHCDSTASHYLKIVLDAIFGKENFKNDLIWKRTSAHNDGNKYGCIHDSLLFYTKSDDYTWNIQHTDYDSDYLEMFLDSVDEDGRRYKRSDLTGAGKTSGDSGQPWKGIDVSSKGRHWAIPNMIIDKIGGEGASAKLNSQQKLDLLESNGKIHWPKKDDGMPRLKQYEEDLPGIPLQDIITDLRPIHNMSDERLGYPTQKPLALLERIINASSNPGDVVLDPFCGCGTAVHAAEKLGRNWIGIDITNLAISLIEKRLRDAFPSIQFEVEGTPKDLASATDLALRDKYQFQWWACGLVGAQPYQGKKKGSDGGIDGLIFFQDDAESAKKIIVSVKGGDNINVAMIRDLVGTLEREKAEIGIFVTLAEPTKPMVTEAVSAGYYESPAGKSFPKIQILTIEELLRKTKRAEYPDLTGGGLTFKKAQKEKKKQKQEGMF